jgi:hypothetical protein
MPLGIISPSTYSNPECVERAACLFGLGELQASTHREAHRNSNMV